MHLDGGGREGGWGTLKHWGGYWRTNAGAFDQELFNATFGSSVLVVGTSLPK